LGGRPLVDGAEAILHNRSFLEAARAAFGMSAVCPELVVVNINAQAPAGNTHIDNPTFRGATRGDYPLPFLRVMGSSGLFEPWRVVRASALSWFYEGVGGSFDYWPFTEMAPWQRVHRQPITLITLSTTPAIQFPPMAEGAAARATLSTSARSISGSCGSAQ
jgi:hypothetical protein